MYFYQHRYEADTTQMYSITGNSFKLRYAMSTVSRPSGWKPSLCKLGQRRMPTGQVQGKCLSFPKPRAPSQQIGNVARHTMPWLADYQRGL